MHARPREGLWACVGCELNHETGGMDVAAIGLSARRPTRGGEGRMHVGTRFPCFKAMVGWVTHRSPQITNHPAMASSNLEAEWLYTLWSPVPDVNVGPLVQKVLAISRRWPQSGEPNPRWLHRAHAAGPALPRALGPCLGCWREALVKDRL